MPSCPTVLIFALYVSLLSKWALKFADVHWTLCNCASITLFTFSNSMFILLSFFRDSTMKTAFVSADFHEFPQWKENLSQEKHLNCSLRIHLRELYPGRWWDLTFISK
jgi:hypothetical protein